MLVQRNVRSEIRAIPPIGLTTILGLERTDYVFSTEWDISIINTSTTASSSVTGFRLENYFFSGTGSPFSSDDIYEKTFKLTHNSGSDIDFPIEIEPGAVERLVLIAPSSV